MIVVAGLSLLSYDFLLLLQFFLVRFFDPLTLPPSVSWVEERTAKKETLNLLPWKDEAFTCIGCICVDAARI